MVNQHHRVRTQSRDWYAGVAVRAESLAIFSHVQDRYRGSGNGWRGGTGRLDLDASASTQLTGEASTRSLSKWLNR
jgi:hypothetical protein